MSSEAGNITNSNNSRTKCPHCGGFFQNQRGVNIHISRSHPDIHRNQVAKKYIRTKNDLPEPININNNLLQSENAVTSELSLKKFKDELSEWKKKFSAISDDHSFDSDVQNFSNFLRNSINILPGPKHPATKYYEARKKNRLRTQKTKHNNSSNPERAKKRERDAKNAQYNYDLTQYLFYNQRRKAIRRVLDTKNESCKINNNDIHSFYTALFSSPNPSERDIYPSKITNVARVELDDLFLAAVSKDEIIQATRRIAVDTSPGPDRVIVRAIRDDTVSEIISKIATRMLQTGVVPACFKKARTILLFKGGDTNDLSNWRPITICSVIRRVIERALNSRLQQYVHFNDNQRGFVNTPGTLINTSILNSVLKSAKQDKDDVTVILLDIRKAFDNIGHTHLHKSLQAEGIPTKLVNLICNLQSDNTTQIETSQGKSKSVSLLRGVMQGSPLSPTLYNIATNSIIDELTDESLSTHYGKTLCPNQPPLTVLGFADDTVIIGKNKEATLELTRIAIQKFNEIGLDINPDKCIGIRIEKGILVDDDLEVDANNRIRMLKQGELIKYLGVTFSDSSNFDSSSAIKNLHKKLDQLASSPLLKSEQKFQALNTSICTSLIYPFQTAELNKIPINFLQDCDKIIKSTLKEILQLPTDTPDHMLYSAPKYKGLGLFKASWEAYLQHVNTCRTLLQSANTYIAATRDLLAESINCVRSLKLTEASEELKNPRTGFYDARRMRKTLREKEYEAWTHLPQKGLGVILYSDYTPANSWIRHRKGLTSSEWRDALKMTAHVSPVRSLPGRTQDTNLCRRCHREPETLAHVLGSCPHGELLRNSRHHTIRSMIAEQLRSIDYQVYEEVHGLAVNGSTRRIDMIAVQPNSSKGYILDPTVRFEKHKDQPEDVNKEKQDIYVPTIPYFLTKYALQEIEVIGLMVGARGSIPKFFIQTWQHFGLQKKAIEEIVITALRGSILLLRHHLYDRQH